MYAQRSSVGFVVAVLLFVASPGAAAQDLPEPRKEGFGIAVMFTGQAGAGRIVSLRVSVPAGRRVGFDFDVGWVFSGKRELPRPIPPERQTGKPIQFRWLPGHITADAHLRWMPRGRRDTGWGTAIIVGARVMQGTAYDANNKKISRYWTKGFDLGLGLDRVLASGHRVGVEGGNSITFGKPPEDQLLLELSGPSIWGSLFGSWVLR